MNLFHKQFCGSVVLTILIAGSVAAQQQASPGETSAASESSQAKREELLAGRRWRSLQRKFDEWLSVQVIYTPEEIAAMKAQLQERIKGLSAEDLEDFMDDSEQRLDLLLGDEVMEARTWLNFMTPQARRARISSEGEIPDVFGMSVSQLRLELNQFQKQRAERTAAHAAFNSSRQQQATGRRQEAAAQQQPPSPGPRQAATFGSQPNFPAPQEPRRREIPQQESPRFWVTPWGIAHPIY